MAGQIRLFEKTSDGLLVEVPPAESEVSREGRLVSSVSIVIDVLWTPEEQAAREAEEEAHKLAIAAQTQRQAEAEALAEQKSTLRLQALAKLQAIGLSPEEIGSLT